MDIKLNANYYSSPHRNKLTNNKERKMYCLCSDKSFDEIISFQSQVKLPADILLETFTSCTSTGCGSCIEPLKTELAAHNLLINNNGELI